MNTAERETAARNLTPLELAESLSAHTDPEVRELAARVIRDENEVEILNEKLDEARDRLEDANDEKDELKSLLQSLLQRCRDELNKPTPDIANVLQELQGSL